MTYLILFILIMQPLTSRTKTKSAYFTKYRVKLEKLNSSDLYLAPIIDQCLNSDRDSHEASYIIGSKNQLSKRQSIKIQDDHHINFRADDSVSEAIFKIESTSQIVDHQGWYKLKEQIKELKQTFEKEKNMKLELASSIEVKKQKIQSLKNDIQTSQQSSPDEFSEMNSTQIAKLQTQILDLKLNHQRLISKLTEQRNQMHFDNVQLSKKLELKEEELEKLKENQAKEFSEQIIRQIKDRARDLESDIEKVAHQCRKVQENIGKIMDVGQISNSIFQKYCEIFSKIVIAKQISKLEDIVSVQDKSVRENDQLMRRKIILKQKKIQLSLKERQLISLTKIKDDKLKRMNQLELQLYSLKNPPKQTLKPPEKRWLLV